MNAVRVLARVIPVLLAPRETAADEEDEFEQAVFWAQQSRVRLHFEEEADEEVGEAGPSSRTERPAAVEEGQFVLADDDQDSDRDEDDGAEPPRPSDPSPLVEPPLAEQLLAALVDLLFVPGLTLPQSSVDSSSSAAVVYTIWCVLLSLPNKRERNPH